MWRIFQYAEIGLNKSERYERFWHEKPISYDPREELVVRKLLNEIDSGSSELTLARAKVRQLLSFMEKKFEILKKLYDVDGSGTDRSN